MPLSSIKAYVNRARTLPMRAAFRGASPDPAHPWPRPTLRLHASPDRKQAPIDGADPLKGELELAKGLEQCIVAVRPAPSPLPWLK